MRIIRVILFNFMIISRYFVGYFYFIQNTYVRSFLMLYTSLAGLLASGQPSCSAYAFLVFATDTVGHLKFPETKGTFGYKIGRKKLSGHQN